MEAVCFIVVLVIVGYICYKIWEAYDKWNQERQKKINGIKGQIDELRRNFEGSLSNFFSSTYGYDTHQSNRDYYGDLYSSLCKVIDNMKSANNQLTEISQSDDESRMIARYSQLASDFQAFSIKLSRFPYTKMMDGINYGKINKSYWDTVRSMSKEAVDSIITGYVKRLPSNKMGSVIITTGYTRALTLDDFTKIFAIDIDMVLKCIWFYATEKPYSAEAFKKAVAVFNYVYKRPIVDITIAELYSMKQMGGEEVLRDKIRNMLKTQHSSEELTLIASALMWMNAYQAENIILQHMLSTGMQMTAKTQERLHSLTNGGGKAPNGFAVSSNESFVYFDVSALAWNDDEYIGMFENLAFQEKTLSYSLAVRDEDKELFITQGINIPTIGMILTKLNEVFSDEYGSDATATIKKCIALSGSGEETITGILAISNKCKQMGVLVHVAHIGKKLNIKFYTLFMPSSTNLSDQKQQALSLYKKLSPSVAMWESSLKDTILFAIQQLLNSTSENNCSSGNSTASVNEPIF